MSKILLLASCSSRTKIIIIIYELLLRNSPNAEEILSALTEFKPMTPSSRMMFFTIPPQSWEKKFRKYENKITKSVVKLFNLRFFVRRHYKRLRLSRLARGNKW